MGLYFIGMELLAAKLEKPIKDVLWLSIALEEIFIQVEHKIIY
jgi:hypothetical protein